MLKSAISAHGARHFVNGCVNDCSVVALRKPCCRKETARCRGCSFWFKVRRQHSLLEIWGRAQREAARRRKSDCRDYFVWFKFRGQQRHLVNESGKLSEIAPKFHLGGSTWAPITFLLVDQSSPSFFAQRGRGCSWSTTFPISDRSIPSRDTRDRSR